MGEAVATRASEIRPDSLLTSHQAGKILQVNPSSINNWVKDGRLNAFRTPGGHRRIRAGDLVNFLSSHQMPIPDPLVGATRKRLLWVQTDEGALKDATRAIAKYEAFVDGVFVDNAVHALVQFGLTRPNVVVFDAVLSGFDTFNAAKQLQTLPGVESHQTFFLVDVVDASIQEDARAVGGVAIERQGAVESVLAALDVIQRP